MSGAANFTESFDPLNTAKAIGSNIKVVAVFEIHILNVAEANRVNEELAEYKKYVEKDKQWQGAVGLPQEMANQLLAPNVVSRNAATSAYEKGTQ